MVAIAMLTPVAPKVRVSPSDSPSFDVELSRLTPFVRAVVAAVLKEPVDHPDTEDCANDALRRAFENRETLRGPVKPWVAGIARHVALDRIRARKRERSRFAESKPEGDSTPSLEETAQSQEPLQDVALEARQDAARMRAALEKLPEGQRNALTLFHLEGLEYTEIASRLGVPIGTVATWILRGRKALMETLGRGEVR
jgi:RNA polymerase sigma-70 factor (ECF subfamily)